MKKRIILLTVTLLVMFSVKIFSQMDGYLTYMNAGYIFNTDNPTVEFGLSHSYVSAMMIPDSRMGISIGAAKNSSIV